MAKGFLNLKGFLDFNDPEIQKELSAYTKYIKQEKSRILQDLILEALNKVRVEPPTINFCKKIDLSTFPNYNSETIGQLLGKQGRHKQIFTNITKVDLEIDKDDKSREKSSVIVLSKYNSINVSKASELIKKVLNTKTWATESISKLYAEVCEEWDAKCIEEGSKVLKEFLEYKEFPKELAKRIGMLQHVYSFSQNIFEHSNEVAQISENIAIELGLDPLKAKRAGFFHDIGKATSEYMDHVDNGLKIAKEAGLEDYILNAIEAHHGRVKANNPYAIIVKAADKLSAGREGARPRQIELVGKRIDMIQKEVMGLGWAEEVIVKNAGNIIEVFLKLKTFSWDKIDAMKAEIRYKLRNLNSEYSYNFEISFKLIYEETFYLEE